MSCMDRAGLKNLKPTEKIRVHRTRFSTTLEGAFLHFCGEGDQ